jgi:hypothetical protein
VPDGVGQRLGNDAVRGQLDRLGQPTIDLDIEVDRDCRAAGQRLQHREQPALGEHCGVQATRDLTQLVDRTVQLRYDLVQLRAEFLGLGRCRLHRAHAQGEGDEPLLGAVVQIPFHPAAGGVARGDDPRP